VNAHHSKAEIFDVFLCHNSEDKPAVRKIARTLAKKEIKPWLDEKEIRPGTSWQFVKRKCPVIPVVLPSAKTTPKLPWTLANRHWVDFRGK
jgi:hypothetical protein